MADNTISIPCDASASTLLECLETLVHCERNLTEAVTRVLPLLPVRLNTAQLEYRLATPHNMQQVAEILSFARTLSSRTSAPSGWNPTLPMIGFATPNPLPHQIRGGSLGTLQLQIAKEERGAAARSKISHAPQPQQGGSETKDKESIPVTRAVDSEALADQRERAHRLAAEEERRRKKAREAEEARQRVTMNLSESSSSEEEDEEEE